jgi:pyrroline-5-carboxylate reductase
MKILLIGAGNMGGAILAGMKRDGVTVVETSSERARQLRETYPEVDVVDTLPAVDGYVVIVAVKPQTFASIRFEGEAVAVISIMAGIPIERLRSSIRAQAYIRAMPNLAALYGKAVISVTGDVAFKAEAEAILSAIGETIWLESEHHLDIATGIGGSAPAWLAMVAEALADGAVNMGLPRQTAMAYLPMLFEGVGALLAHEHPAILKDKVSSPGGTTIAGLAALERNGVRQGFIEAMEACYARTQSL